MSRFMKHYLLRFVVFLLPLSIGLGSGCAGSKLSSGHNYLQKGDYEQAAKNLLSELKADRGNAAAWRDLGIAYYKLREFKKCRLALTEAQRLQPEDTATLFYLGAVAESLQDYGEAVRWFREYARRGPGGPEKRQLEARLDWLQLKQAEQEARRALTNPPAPSTYPENQLAILTLRNLAPSAESAALGRGLADGFIRSLSGLPDVKVVDRRRMQIFCDAFTDGGKRPLNHETALGVARALKAGRLITGSYRLSKEQLELHLQIYNTADGTRLDSLQGAAERTNFYLAAKTVLADLLARLNLVPGEEALSLTTRSLPALLAYSHGLEALDRGLNARARAELQKALALDPDFRAAREQLMKSDVYLFAATPLERLEPSPAATPPAPAAPAEIRQRLSATLQTLGAGFAPVMDPGQPGNAADIRSPAEERSGPTNWDGTPVPVKIRLPKP